jgi:hypothetical protein
VELVGAGLRDDLNLRPGIAAIDRGEIIGDDPHFLDRLGVGRQVGDPPARDAVGAGVIDREGIGLVALATGVDARRGFAGKRVIGAAAAADRRRDPLARHARLQRDQVVQVSAAQRHLLQLQAIDASRHAALLRLDERRRGGDGHAFLHAGDLQGEVQAGGFADADGDGIALRLEEPRLLH